MCVYIYIYIYIYIHVYIYWSCAMVALVGLMVMTCKARRNGSEARAASVRDPWLIVDNCLFFTLGMFINC